jgi:hypothetical protein
VNIQGLVRKRTKLLLYMAVFSSHSVRILQCLQQVFKMAAYGLLKATGNPKVRSDGFLTGGNRIRVDVTFLTPCLVTYLIVQ